MNAVDVDLFGESVEAIQARRELDRYYTADEVADALVEQLAIPAGSMVLEPSVGGGAFVRAVRRHVPGAYVIGFDLDPDARGFGACDEAFVGDTVELLRSMPGLRVDVAIGNPAFSVAREHVEALVEHVPRVVLVLPLGMAELFSERWDFWTGPALPLAQLVFMGDRPSFVGGKTMQVPTAAFDWRRGHVGRPAFDILSWKRRALVWSSR